MKTTKRKREPAAAAAPETPVAAAPAASKAAPKAARKAAPGIVLASNCGVKDAAELKQSLCKLAGESGAVAIDVRNLERLDTATMQLLCAFVRDRAAHDLKVEWQGDSSVLHEAARLLGVTELLALPPQSANNLGAAA
jgi:ABC-type transporter Mla MlaB component